MTRTKAPKSIKHEERVPVQVDPALQRAMARPGPWNWRIQQIELDFSDATSAYTRGRKGAADTSSPPAVRAVAQRCADRAYGQVLAYLEEAAACVVDTERARLMMNSLVDTALLYLDISDPQIAARITLIEQQMDGRTPPVAAKPKRRLAIIGGRDVA
ncbi:MAG TPA: hypothetical protein VHL31_19600 [Geminicoccus sp.]|jgi:hypothetical protein|uniref:hypothetical protein n=1 Tax=Geminicoccus sp. TaxID=2024832 RepID=UPI002E2F7867|nr:hypothetical protein [Geminicoccus sp.]HEX2528492.1 hypothetical protein [Geminicoccus sp.]